MKFEPFKDKIWLSTPTQHGNEMEFIKAAFDSNWITTEGENLTAIESLICERVGCRYAVPLSSGTAALHLAVKLAGISAGDTVFCTDMTFTATVNAILYEKAHPVFIDAEYDTWNMDPVALERAFALYPKTKAVIVVDLYGTPAKYDEITAIAKRHGAVIIEDAAESLGATYKGRHTGTYGAYNVISFNGNKIITGSSGGMLLTDDLASANDARRWSAQSREAASWYQHKDVGYNYGLSNLVAGMIRAQIPYLDEHVARKKEIYERYKDGFKGMPLRMNPYDADVMEPNFWLSCILIDSDAMCEQVRTDTETHYVTEAGKTCPDEIFDTLAKYNVQARHIWKPMHLQPLHASCDFVSADGSYGRGESSRAGESVSDVGADIFSRGLCLPSDIKMTHEQQDKIIDIVKSCFE